MGHIALVQTTAIWHDFRFREHNVEKKIAKLRTRIMAYDEKQGWCGQEGWRITAAALLIGPVHATHNGYVSVTLLPEGSKSGWRGHDEMLAFHKELAAICDRTSGYCTHVIVDGGDEEPHIVTDIEEE